MRNDGGRERIREAKLCDRLSALCVGKASELEESSARKMDRLLTQLTSHFPYKLQIPETGCQLREPQHGICYSVSRTKGEAAPLKNVFITVSINSIQTVFYACQVDVAVQKSRAYHLGLLTGILILSIVFSYSSRMLSL